MKIEEALQQQTFTSEYHKVHLNILYTSAWISQHTAAALKPFGLSGQQFNILRILRGQYPEPASVKLLTARMIDKMSNASRLVDKLLEKELVVRTTCPNDRRSVDVVLTEKGLEVLAAARTAVEVAHQPLNGALTDDEAQTLNRLLDKMRAGD